MLNLTPGNNNKFMQKKIEGIEVKVRSRIVTGIASAEFSGLVSNSSNQHSQ